MPLPDERLSEAEELIRQCSDAELAALGLGPPPRPVVPRTPHDGAGPGGGSKDAKSAAAGAGVGVGAAMTPQQRLTAVQQVINSLQYNHTPGYYYNVSKARPFSRIMETARETLRSALPIKCLEAVFLGALLTAGWHDLDRLPLAFKSTVQGQTYRHIVLVVYHAPSRKWGALGLSRRPELMDKDLVYDSLADLVSEYKAAYERWWHALIRVYAGLPLEHDTFYQGPVCWRFLTLSLTGRKSWAAHRAALDTFAGQARRLAAKFRALGVLPTLGAAQALDGQGQGQGQGQDAPGRSASTAANSAASVLAAGPAMSLNISEIWWSEKQVELPVTVFTTATLDRLNHLEALCRALPGAAMSAAVYLPLVQRQGATLPQRNANILLAGQQTLRALFDRLEGAPGACSMRLMLLTEFTSDPALAALVPINSLRNAALLAVRTPLAAMIDVDLALSDSMMRMLADAKRLRELQAAPSTMWVFPAWEANPQLDYAEAHNVAVSALKGDKRLLSSLWSSRTIRVFAEDIYYRGHHATEYHRWLRDSEPYSITYERGYEPWGVLSRKQHTQMPYDARFRGCYRDKVTHVAALSYSGVSFMAVPDAWLVHQPHNLSAAATIALGNSRVMNARVKALQQVVFYRGVNTTKFMLHKAHSLVTSDEALGEMGRGVYAPVVSEQFRTCTTQLAPA
ncbi:hypothetical protein GPECTOR_19g267 [Gonium pectorale]|uniref:Uncharacterized protein n=1 Tax=Gonium pectorale TaxID=33097 RepID=A0A150GJ48_GONPE|nr:hypothetical protein GPECTOR_19g267 [Gonium pectorale]|eukprot:KXZ49816.1 hypothetical protein GPECTOR_19g267 [Gonium pectorale]